MLFRSQRRDRPMGRRTLHASALLLAGVFALGCYSSSPQAGTCESLLSVHLPDTLIKTAESIPAGTYQPPGSATAFSGLPAFCRVTATVSPAPGSAIGIEVWLPAANWNGKYQQSGNHGSGATFFWNEMVPQIQRGYATGITDDGHGGPGGYDMTWAFGNPEKVTDFAYRAVHELADKAKALIVAFYGRPQRYAYFNGCSNGGREGIKNAQMFPHDFNGIIFGGAASQWTRASTELLVESQNWAKAGMEAPSGAIFTLAQNAETAACDGLDGVVDGVLNDPRRCHWNPASLVCAAGQNPSSCITAAQAAAFSANEQTLRDPVTDRWIFSGQEPASEQPGQAHFLGALNSQGLNVFSVNMYQFAFNDLTWNGSTFDLHTDYPILDRALGSFNATDSDLTPFKRAGGKLIQWHGWEDSSFTPGWEIRYYDEVVDRTGHGNLPAVQDFYRLFMMPGVSHCGGGPGPDDIGGEDQTPVSHDPEHDVVSALETWVEQGVPPRQLIATKFNTIDVPSSGIAMQRPICPYPSEAAYKGSGDTNQASSFFCSRGPRDGEPFGDAARGDGGDGE